MNSPLPPSIVRYQQALEDAIRRDLAAAPARRRRAIRFALAGSAAVALGLGAARIITTGGPLAAQPASAAIIRGAAAALAQTPGTILHVAFTETQDNGDGTTVGWSQESWTEQSPPYDSRLLDKWGSGTPAGVEAASANGVEELYDPTRNTIYIGPPPSQPKASKSEPHRYTFSPGPTPGTSRVRVPGPKLFKLNPKQTGPKSYRVLTLPARTLTVTDAQARALRSRTDIIVWTVRRHGNPSTSGEAASLRPDVRHAPPVSSDSVDGGGADPWSGAFRDQILALLRSGRAWVAGHATVDGQDAIKIVSAHGDTVYYVAPNSYIPIELTTKGTSGGTSTHFDVYEQLPAATDGGLVSLAAQHPTATVDHSAVDYQAADSRLFPHG